MKQILLSLCARGGSKGIPGKNTRLLNGKPLIAYSIETAQQLAAQLPAQVHIALSTDAAYIKEAAAQFGIQTAYTRPDSLASDTAGKVAVWEDLLAWEERQAGIKYDYFLDLDISSPLRSLQDLLEAFQCIENDPEALCLYSVSHAHKNPYFNMVEPDGNGYYQLVKQGTFLTRQSAPPVYALNASFYYLRRAFFDLPEKKVVNNRSLIYCMEHICFDLDESVDFEFMEFLMANNRLGFSL